MCLISSKASFAKRDKIAREKKTLENQDSFRAEKKFPSKSSGFAVKVKPIMFWGHEC